MDTGEQKGMDPFAARRNNASNVSWARTDSDLGMPLYISCKTDSNLGMPSYPTHLTTHRTCSTLAGLAEEFNSALKMDEAKPGDSPREPTGNDISRPPGTFYSAPVGAPAVSSTLVAPPGSGSAQYQWLNSSTAYSSFSAEDRTRPGASSRSPRRGQQEGEATEEDWNHREEKRADPVQALKATSVYLDNQDFVPRPQTPDPACRLSKRRWETEIAKWRNDWREVDAVRKLVKMGFEESNSRDAWRNAKPKGKQSQQPHDQDSQLKEAINILSLLSQQMMLP